MITGYGGYGALLDMLEGVGSFFQGVDERRPLRVGAVSVEGGRVGGSFFCKGGWVG